MSIKVIKLCDRGGFTMNQKEMEQFWSGEFGTQYIERCKDSSIVSSNIALFSKVLSSCSEPVKEIIEYGSNIGLSLLALKSLLPHCEDISAVEIHELAVERCQELIKPKHIYRESILDFEPDYQRDFVLVKGLLIHIHADMLQKAYEKLYQTSKKYICICEYYNPTPVEVVYHETGRIYKRDFCGEMMDKYPGLKLVDYGFVYHRDYKFPQDDMNWFLLEK